ncbi:MAG TPA: carboxypeptidase-like regulatory domain-containing protein [Candidatus Wunengus sp. YC60]|uniref:carboxypeptidase-like regulatory domain-containing protein n=1 Tax=Candidatus Wunengus sp. YC60 TaxID=3367697 RepID=UPI00402626B8
MFRKILVSAIVVLLASKAVYAFETGTLRGKVLDGFGKPINFANITVVSNGSKAKTTSDPTGVFSISYNPGNLKLTFDKEGYVPLYVPLSLDETTDLSVGDIVLWKIPPKGGLFVVGDGDYIGINSSEYYSETGSKERRFLVKGSPTVIKGQDVKIIDFQTDNPLVIGKTLYSVDSKGSVGSIILYPSQKYVLNKEEDTYTKIADNVGMRKINLPPGRYFYCTGEITIRSKIGFGFYFEISS